MKTVVVEIVRCDWCARPVAIDQLRVHKGRVECEACASWPAKAACRKCHETYPTAELERHDMVCRFCRRWHRIEIGVALVR